VYLRWYLDRREIAPPHSSCPIPIKQESWLPVPQWLLDSRFLIKSSFLSICIICKDIAIRRLLADIETMGIIEQEPIFHIGGKCNLDLQLILRRYRLSVLRYPNSPKSIVVCNRTLPILSDILLQLVIELKSAQNQARSEIIVQDQVIKLPRS
jgi:hypothetical protein